MRLIGINGFKRSGKGETGLAVQRLLDEKFQTTTLIGFADKLKILAAKNLGFTDRSDAECIALMDECKEEWIISILKQFDGTDDVRFPQIGESEFHRLTGREYLQNLGNEARGVFGADFWVDQVLPHHTIKLPGMYGTDAVAFTDLRYPNEAQRILDLGGETWEIVRPGLTSDGHASEQPLPRELVTRTIINDGDLANLEYRVEKALGL